MARPPIGNVDPLTEFIVCRGVPLDNTYQRTLTFPDKETQLAYFQSKQKFNLVENRYQRVTSNVARLKLNAESVFDCNYICFCNHGFTAAAAEANRAVVPYTYEVVNPNPPPPTKEEQAEWVHFPPEWGSISTPENDRWWYAFITDITYINNGTCDITYEIDVMQSYAFDYTLLPSMVERAHVQLFDETGKYMGTDSIYANRIDEDLPIGELFEVREERAYLNAEGNFNDDTTQLKLLFIGSGYENNEEQTLNYPSRLPTFMKDVRVDTPENIISRVNDYVTKGKEGNISSIIMVPGCFTNADVAPSTSIRPYSLPNDFSTPHSLSYFYDYIDGKENKYFAINGKLMQYPYNRLIATNYDGAEREVRFELFNNLNDPVGFTIRRAIYPAPIIGCFPANYNLLTGSGSAERDNISLDNAVYKSGYPVTAWPGDTYKMWWAQNIGSGAAVTQGLGKFLTGAISGGLAIASLAAKGLTTVSPFAGALLSGALAVEQNNLNLNTQEREARAQPDTNYGASFKPQFNLAQNLNCFGFIRRSITATRAAQIDRFFSMFGYLWNSVFVPSGWRQGTGERERWNFIKLTTVSIQAGVQINAKHLAQIKQNFLNGITFWHLKGTDDSFVGDYSDAAMEINHPDVDGRK